MTIRRIDPDDLVFPAPLYTQILCGIVLLVCAAVTVFVWAIR